MISLFRYIDDEEERLLSRELKIGVAILLVFASLFFASASHIPTEDQYAMAETTPLNNHKNNTLLLPSQIFESETDVTHENLDDSSVHLEVEEIIGNPEFEMDEEGIKEDPENQRPQGSGETVGDDTVDVDTPPPSPEEPGESETEKPTEKPTQAPSESETEKPTEKPTEPPVYSDGWHVIDGKTYLYQSGKPVTGWQVIQGKKYYFDSKGVLSSKVGIDVSYAQGSVDWKKVKAAGVDYVMIRVGYRGYTQGGLYLDSDFVKNIEGATAAGLDCGVYFYSQAITVEEAILEADFVLKAIKGYDLTYPVAFDTEDVNDPIARTKGLTDKQRTDFAIAFCERILNSGYYPTIYASKSWLLDEMEFSRINGKFDIWLAEWTDKATFPYTYQMWQYTENGSVSGISGYVDLDVSLFDYPTFIKKNGYNNL